ncbi:unnamed protein product [Amoebophrya sp. A120]|nr:unnamed protein product [Amoebophrya sp. A120]|eukprot:GSA120T00010937001.1
MMMSQFRCVSLAAKLLTFGQLSSSPVFVAGQGSAAEVEQLAADAFSVTQPTEVNNVTCAITNATDYQSRYTALGNPNANADSAPADEEVRISFTQTQDVKYITIKNVGDADAALTKSMFLEYQKSDGTYAVLGGLDPETTKADGTNVYTPTMNATGPVALEASSPATLADFFNVAAGTDRSVSITVGKVTQGLRLRADSEHASFDAANGSPAAICGPPVVFVASTSGLAQVAVGSTAAVQYLRTSTLMKTEQQQAYSLTKGALAMVAAARTAMTLS